MSKKLQMFIIIIKNIKIFLMHLLLLLFMKLLLTVLTFKLTLSLLLFIEINNPYFINKFIYIKYCTWIFDSIISSISSSI